MNDPDSEWSARARHSRAYAGLFLVFLACGLLAGIPVGRSLFRSNRSLYIQALEDQSGLTQPATGQNSWLVIGVDDLQAAAPRLQSAWLALFFPDRPIVTLLPVFPVPGAEYMLEAFSLDRHGEPSASFLEALYGNRLWWNGYLVLDYEGLIALVAFLDEEGSASIQELAWLGGDNHEILDTKIAANPQVQADMLVNACRQANDAFDPAEIILLAADLSPHLRTDLDLAQVARAWPLTAAGRLKVDCEFPVIAVSR